MKNLAVFSVVCFLSMLAAAQASPASPAKPADDYSGMYGFLQEGEFVQVTVEDAGHVTGFVSRYGDSDSDRGAFLDQFFKDGKLEGKNLRFATETVHGVWYSFEGTVERGNGKTPNEEAYYVLQGMLTQFNTDANKKISSKSRKVEFKSFPRDLGAPADKPD